MDYKLKTPVLEESNKTLNDLVKAKLSEIMQFKETYITAWIAATGVHPKDAIIIEDRTDPFKTIWYVREMTSTEKMDRK
jgi:hypothetical protein